MVNKMFHKFLSKQLTPPVPPVAEPPAANPGFFDKTFLFDTPFGTYEIWLWYICLLAVLAVAVAAAAVILLNKKKKVITTKVEAMEEVSEDTVTQDAQAAAAGPRILPGVYQHIGAREDQQDSYGVSDPNVYSQAGLMAVVADGMGGLANGRAVSAALVRTFQEGFRYNRTAISPAELLLELAARANAAVNQMLRGQERSGSTLVCAIIQNGYLYFLTVGDSRIYLYRGGALLQLNREHIYQEELAAKVLNQAATIQQVRGDRQAHSLTSYFGIGRIPGIDRNYEGIKLVSGDKLLLASDGVFGTLTQSQLEAALAQEPAEAAKTMGEWIRQANRPHQDNNTAVVLEYRA